MGPELGWYDAALLAHVTAPAKPAGEPKGTENAKCQGGETIATPAALL